MNLLTVKPDKGQYRAKLRNQKVWSSGGTPKILMVGPVNKQRVSGFSGIASSRFNIDGGAKPATLVGAVDIYVN